MTSRGRAPHDVARAPIEGASHTKYRVRRPRGTREWTRRMKKARRNVLDSRVTALYSASHCRLSRQALSFPQSNPIRAHTEVRAMWKQREEPPRSTSVPANP